MPVANAGFDVAIVGARVIGCAVFREFVLAGAASVLIERDADIISGASKGNSAILHTGFDAPANSLELACIREGAALYGKIHARLGGPPLQRTGAVVVAWNEAEAEALDGIVARAHANGVEDVRLIGREELRAREPALAPTAVAGVLVPSEAIVECDGVIFTGRFVPEAALVRDGLACDPRTGGPVIDNAWRTSDPAVFAAGKVLRPVEHSGWVAAEARQAALAILRALGSRLPDPSSTATVSAGGALRYV